jgi:hypothetical protein
MKEHLRTKKLWPDFIAFLYVQMYMYWYTLQIKYRKPTYFHGYFFSRLNLSIRLHDDLFSRLSEIVGVFI